MPHLNTAQLNARRKQRGFNIPRLGEALGISSLRARRLCYEESAIAGAELIAAMAFVLQTTPEQLISSPATRQPTKGEGAKVNRGDTSRTRTAT